MYEIDCVGTIPKRSLLKKNRNPLFKRKTKETPTQMKEYVVTFCLNSEMGGKYAIIEGRNKDDAWVTARAKWGSAFASVYPMSTDVMRKVEFYKYEKVNANE